LPDSIVNGLRESFPDGNLLFGPGNLFGLYLCGGGLEKDGIKKVYMLLPYSSYEICLMKIPRK
jgi:hypothetical protein